MFEMLKIFPPAKFSYIAMLLSLVNSVFENLSTPNMLNMCQPTYLTYPTICVGISNQRVHRYTKQNLVLMLTERREFIVRLEVDGFSHANPYHGNVS